MEVWKSTNNGDTKLVIFNNNIIYSGNPRDENMNNAVYDIKNNRLPDNMMSIPLSYLKKIEKKEKNIELFYGSKSSERIVISNDSLRNTIFDYLKNNITHLSYSQETISAAESVKKSIIALIVILIAFFFTMTIVFDLENGYDYEIHSPKSIFTIIYVIASLGRIKVFLIFSSLMLITGINIFMKAKSSVNDILKRNN
ncbi:hypothetical protein QFZ37_000109 [Chryseobacterium ginsenosidimutans]|uniref:hypothetical protein n=1 Tax=Chryseobacterium ginsenosidimutans TaxID=687846 RepID=UPI0027839E2F|nr:hypothetical protein [Chryseobacterium ginsenosidimutans]MDQ0591740.1 hypothetical protein [Chryseobacterium ginsenosidimutans]